MEFLAFFSVSSFIDFFILGIFLNIIGVIISTLVLFIKTLSLDAYEQQKLFEISAHVDKIINENNSPLKRSLRFLCTLLPMYTLLNSIYYIYIMLSHKGLKGILIANTKIEDISLVPLIKLKLRIIPNK